MFIKVIITLTTVSSMVIIFVIIIPRKISATDTSHVGHLRGTLVTCSSLATKFARRLYLAPVNTQSRLECFCTPLLHFRMDPRTPPSDIELVHLITFVTSNESPYTAIDRSFDSAYEREGCNVWKCTVSGWD